jgi:hypothetical protein
MKFDGFPEEKTILSYKLANSVGWLTAHRLSIKIGKIIKGELLIMEVGRSHFCSQIQKISLTG